MKKEIDCPCGSKKPYDGCCAPLHKGIAPGDALQLMRSRYCAYALNLPNYIVMTTHRDHPEAKKNRPLWLEEISQFSLITKFKRLDVLSFKEMGNFATVSFVAHLEQDGKKIRLKEKSLFEKVLGRWLYLRGDVLS
jgi:SEC-C motif domain protein